MGQPEVKFYDHVDDALLKYAVIIAKHQGKWVFCRHRERDTLEIPGGHREPGETILETARRELAEETQRRSAGYEGCQVNICLNYGGRDEILRAAKALAAECAEGKRSPDTMTEEDISNHLWSAGVPDPDLVIRPSGEVRLSNFLLWQSAYAEFYVTDVSWPDFSKEDLRKALAAYQGRSRRFGGV